MEADMGINYKKAYLFVSETLKFREMYFWIFGTIMGPAYLSQLYHSSLFLVFIVPHPHGPFCSLNTHTQTHTYLIITGLWNGV